MYADPHRADVEAALAGDGAALEQLLKVIEPTVFGLGVRMLGNRADAEDATQEVLVRIATHLSSFGRESLFTTWSYRLASNAIIDQLRARTSIRQFEQIADDLEEGLARSEANQAGDSHLTASAESQAIANEMALVCTQGMLSALDTPHRLAYILGEVFEFTSEQAAAIAEVTPSTYRQQLSRARERLRSFMSDNCGLVSDRAACRCEKQVRGLAAKQVLWLSKKPISGGARHATLPERDARAGMRELDELQRVSRVFQSHPEYLADADLVDGIRARISATVFGRA